MLSLADTRELLKKYGLPFPKTFLCNDLGEVLERASGMRFPLVLKASSLKETHKTEKGLVQLGIHSLDELSLAFSRLQHKTKHFDVEAFILQEQQSGVEFIVGCQKDEVFGRSVLFGLGGIYAELFEDVVVRVCPLRKSDAIAMTNQTRAHAFFGKGFRGKKASLNAVVDVLLKTSHLMEKENVLSLDFNPVIVDEHKSSVVDARVVME